MKIIFAVNNLTETSVPRGWCKTFKQLQPDWTFELVSVSQVFRKLVAMRSCDVIHCHHVKSGLVFLLFSWFFDCRFVYTWHGSFTFLSRLNRFGAGLILKFADRVIFVNQCLFDELPKRYREKCKGNTEIILNGVDMNFRHKQIDVMKDHKIPRFSEYIFHPARFVPEKNHHRLIRSFARISKSRDVALLLAGDGALKSSLDDLLVELGVKDKVFMLGTIPRDEVYCFLDVIDLFVMPSISEGLNIAFLEALSKGKKIVVSEIEQFTYPFNHYNIQAGNMNTLFCDPLCVDGMSQTLIEALDRDVVDPKGLESFSIEHMFREYKTVYLNCIK